MAKKLNNVEICKKEVQAAIEGYMDAYKNKSGLAIKQETLNNALKMLNKTYKAQIYTEIRNGEHKFKKDSNILEDAINLGYYNAFKLVENKDDDGVITGIVLSQERMTAIDLEDFCKNNGLSTTWVGKLQCFNIELAVLKMINLGAEAKELEAVAANTKCNHLQEVVSDYIKHTEDSKAKNPVSKKSLEASLDAIVKLLLPSSKALKEDLQYFDDLYLTSGKNFKEVRFANKSKMKRYFTEDLHKILTGKPFGFDAAALKD